MADEVGVALIGVLLLFLLIAGLLWVVWMLEARHSPGADLMVLLGLATCIMLLLAAALAFQDALSIAGGW
jgi:F0F1-type ATP synthase membrane subunit a